ncbi:MAG: ABC transporter ATP-binding protein [Phycisphaerae bacterium]
MVAATIQTVNLTKRYVTGGQALLALSNLNLTIEEGDCFGFIGPNGAGKTTTIKILATLLQPTWGEARICDYVVGYESRKIRPLIGYVPDSFGAYEDMVVQEYLEFFAAAYEIHGAKRRQLVQDVLALTDLAYKRDALVDSLSRGMQQRLSLARVLLHDPKVLLLDEPASGLDPRARIEIRELLKELKKMGKTILISSHILPELAELCNKVGIIERGELLFAGTVEAAMRQATLGQVLHVRVGQRQPEAMDLLKQTNGIAGVIEQHGVLHVTLNAAQEDYAFVAQRLVAGGYDIHLLKPEEINLETAFMRLTKGVVQ